MGDYTKKTHEEVGDMIAEQDIDVLVTYGHNAMYAARRVADRNKDIQVHACLDVEDVYHKVSSLLSHESLMLYKCSNTDDDLMTLKEHFLMNH